MRFRTYKTTGLVLRQYDLREADRILSMLTPDLGKVRVVAKGVRRSKSRLRGRLDLMNVVDFAAAYGRDLDVVTEAQIRDDHQNVRSDLARLSMAVYACELIDSLAQEGAPSRDMFELAVESLDSLGHARDPWLTLRWFEVRILDVSGFKPELERCVECSKGLEPRDYLIDLALGGVLCPACRTRGMGCMVGVSERAMRVLRHLQRTLSTEALTPLRIGAGLRSEIEMIQTRYVRSVIERELKSGDFVRLTTDMTPLTDG